MPGLLPSAVAPSSSSATMMNGHVGQQRAFAPTSSLQLSVSARNLKNKEFLSKSDPLCIMYVRHGDRWHEAGRTEQLDNNLNPVWNTRFTIDYHFEARQMLKFEVYDWDKRSDKLTKRDYLGKMKCSLGMVLAAPGRQFVSAMKGPSKDGQFIVIAEEVAGGGDSIKMHFAATGLDKKDTFSKSDPLLIISKLMGQGQYVPVHRTEVIQNTLNPSWKPFSLSVRDLCNGDWDKTLRFEVFDWDARGKSDLIGGFTTSLRELSTAMERNHFFPCINPEKLRRSGYSNSGEVFLKYFLIERQASFLDYVRGGTILNFSVGIDFTASNGDPNDRSSLHFRNPGGSNQYTTAIRAVGGIIQDYDTDRHFPALGFGAKVPPDGRVSHEFFLNLRHDNPFCTGVMGILQAYYTALQHVTLYGPTMFAPIIRHNARLASAYSDGRQYFVLMIITDGIITDMEETKAAIVEASHLPMSIIIIGVGNENFKDMEILDADRGMLRSKVGTAVRDIVQFVELRRFIRPDGLYNRELLAQHVLAEVPRQLVGWMTMKGVKPIRTHI